LTTSSAKAGVKGKSQAIVAALASGPYLPRLSSRSALFTELKLLLSSDKNDSTSDAYRHLIVDENCLAKTTTASRQRTWEELRSRYILNTGDPLFCSFQAEWANRLADSEASLTIYCLFALNDRLVADLGVNYLFPRLRQAPSPIRVDDIEAFLYAARASHPELCGWSEQTTAAVARKYAASIRDFGLAKGVYAKTSVRPALYAAPARFLIRALRLTGMKDLDIVSSPWFRLIGVESHEVLDALSELSRQGKLGFRMQADVVELDLEGRQR
jgi:hypothetical protein